MNNKKMPSIIVILKNKKICLQFFIFIYLHYALLSIKLEFLWALKSEEDFKKIFITNSCSYKISESVNFVRIDLLSSNVVSS